jgi:hypothetical protein
MSPDPWRLVVRLKSHRALVEYVNFHNLTGRGLARKAGLKPAVVGHLLRASDKRSARRTCSLETARAIEEALSCPPGFLFEPSMSPVADTARQTAA